MPSPKDIKEKKSMKVKLLILYKVTTQATHGECNSPRPLRIFAGNDRNTLEATKGNISFRAHVHRQDVSVAQTVTQVLSIYLSARHLSLHTTF